jgi:iron complex transport system substrate-binding protein
MPVLEALRPDLMVTQALCNVCAVAEDEVRAASCALPGSPRVVNLEPRTLSDVFEAIRDVGRAAGVPGEADRYVAALTARVDAVVTRAATATYRPRVALLEWLDPPFACGHWNPELVRLAGGVEGLGQEGEPSRQATWEEVVAWRPEVVLISCCGFDVERTIQDIPLLDRVAGWGDLPAVRDDRVYVTNGSAYFSRPGPRLVESLEILAHVIDPDLHPSPDMVTDLVRVARWADRMTVRPSDLSLRSGPDRPTPLGSSDSSS